MNTESKDFKRKINVVKDIGNKDLTNKIRGNAKDNMQKVLDKLHGTQNRTANFKTVIALIIDGVENLFQGECKGDITNIRCGAEGFGYDPIFIPHTFDKTFAEMTKQEKGLISHRGKAVKKLLEFLSTG